MNLTKTKKNLPLILIAALAIVAVLAAILQAVLPSAINNLNQSQSQNQIPTSADTQNSYNQSFEKNMAQEFAHPDPFQLIANLRVKLPYKGTNFTLDYDYDNAKFVLTLHKGNEAAGNAEFDKYLQANGVDKSKMKIQTKVQ